MDWEKNSKIFCSSLNSDTSVAPHWDASFTPIPSTGAVKKMASKRDEKKMPSKKNEKRMPSKKNECVQKENVQSQVFYKYTEYLQSVYASTLMNDLLLEEKSQIKGCLDSLSKELEMQRNTFEKASVFLKDISYCAEKEAALKSQSNKIEDILNVLDKILSQDTVSITNKLNTVRHIVPTKNIKVCQDSSEVVELQRIMDSILTRLRTISECVHPYADSYAQAGKVLRSVIESQEIIASDVQSALNIKSAVRDELLLRCSQWKSKLLQKELEGGGDNCSTLKILKEFSEVLMGQRN
ncbi:uncharacterized protein [Anabrus simplex]|uniref:uncharacterized protein isoform X2 n=1 Tax=Anabrus simplex TaxID=316456 RepID=UPI0035A39533